MIANDILKEFKEKYDRDSIKSIVNLSNDITMYKSSFDGFNLKESVDKFKLFIDGYTEYCTESYNNGTDKQSNAFMLERAKMMVNNELTDKLFESTIIPFMSAESFVQEYVDAINDLSNTVISGQSTLMEHTNDAESIGCVVEFTEIFINELNNRFYPVMEHLLNSSGYHAKKQIRTPINRPEPKPLFL